MKSIHHEQLWQKAFAAALTGLTMAGAMTMSQSSTSTDLEPRGDDDDGGENNADSPGTDSPVASDGETGSDYHAALVAEATRIADAAWYHVIGTAPEKREENTRAGAAQPPKRPAPKDLAPQSHNERR